MTQVCQYPEYWSDPESEIRQSLSLLKNNPLWKERYQAFIDTMVYANALAQEYEEVIDSLYQYA